MTDNSDLAPVRQLIERCRIESGWPLDDDAVKHYAQAVAPFLSELAEERWAAVIANYHADHLVVDALRDSAAYNHDDLWERWCAQVVGVLRRAGRDWSRDGMLDADDLAQEARIALVGALPSYRYQSRFSSWAYSVMTFCARNQIRALGAQRRSGATISLSALDETSQPADLGESHERAALACLLAERIAARLGTQPDRRLAYIFHLWVAEDRTSAEIGAIVNLHESRVRALLKQTRELLRADPEIRSWNDDQS